MKRKAAETPATGHPTPEVLERLDEISDEIAVIAPVVKSAIVRTLEEQISLEQAASIQRSAEILLGLYELESTLLLRHPAG